MQQIFVSHIWIGTPQNTYCLRPNTQFSAIHYFFYLTDTNLCVVITDQQYLTVYTFSPWRLLSIYLFIQTVLSVSWEKKAWIDVCLWDYHVGHWIETSSLVCFTQRHEIASPLFHFLLIRRCNVLFFGQLFFSRYKDYQDGVSLSLAQRGSTSLTYYFRALPHLELWLDTGFKGIKKKKEKLWRAKGRRGRSR